MYTNVSHNESSDDTAAASTATTPIKKGTKRDALTYILPPLL
jgi:hypothetical protein